MRSCWARNKDRLCGVESREEGPTGDLPTENLKATSNLARVFPSAVSQLRVCRTFGTLQWAVQVLLSLFATKKRANKVQEKASNGGKSDEKV